MGIRRNAFLITIGVCVLVAGGCRTMVVGVNQPVAVNPGPPAHAPAYGHRARHQYRYYPQEQVYFDPGRQVYFYLEGPGWRMSASLPSGLQVEYSQFVSIEMEQDKPYLEFEKHRTKYPRHHDTEKKKKKKKRKG